VAFVGVAKVEEILPGQVRSFEIEDLQVSICNVDGELYAIEDVCTHDESSFAQGELDGCEIECPRHGARFDVTTGNVTALPAVLPLETFPVRINQGNVEIDIG
tara:strand:- start:266 stop:574 length:309 start_codon:yes stop_codon:yes gene_type:complete